ncbi:histidine kinase [Cytobacillus sp. FJAT-53684]|uniref:histidine kinase n=1 Tax=Cytobacillus mangrovibacter TaxID=3299024 RepID=A0ABW6JU85_9BACI
MGNSTVMELTRLEALSKVSIALSETLSLDSLLYKAVTQCIEILKFDAAIVYLLDEERKFFVATHHFGIPYDSIRQLKKLPTDSIGGIVVKGGQTIVTEDLVKYYEQRPQVEEYKSLISVPIKVRRETIGVLDVFSKEQRWFTKEDISLLESIGLQIGVASENAKIFKSVECVTEKLRELVELSHKLSSCLNLDKLIDLIIGELKKMFRANVLFLSLTEEKNVQIQAHKRCNGLTLTYDSTIDQLLHISPNQGFTYSSNEPNQFGYLFEKLGIHSALCVNFQYKDKVHCLIVGKETDYCWEDYELEAMEGISKTISLALFNSYLIIELEDSRKENSNLLALQLTTQERERQRIAQEIHDSINQSMVGVYFHLQYCRDEIQSSPENVKKILDKLLGTTTDNIQELRRIIYDLHPVAIEKYGFIGAVEQLVLNYSEQGILNINVAISGDPFRWQSQVEIHLYRVIQECLNNILKHSQTDRASIFIFYEPYSLKVTIQDNGIGFDVYQKFKEGRAYGLIGMKKRVQDLGGNLVILSERGKGTTIEITVTNNGGMTN